MSAKGIEGRVIVSCRPLGAQSPSRRPCNLGEVCFTGDPLSEPATPLPPDRKTQVNRE